MIRTPQNLRRFRRPAHGQTAGMRVVGCLAAGFFVSLSSLGYADSTAPAVPVGNAASCGLKVEDRTDNCGLFAARLSEVGKSENAADYMQLVALAKTYYATGPGCPEYAYLMVIALDKFYRFRRVADLPWNDKKPIVEDNEIIKFIGQTQNRNLKILPLKKPDGQNRAEELTALLTYYTEDRDGRLATAGWAEREGSGRRKRIGLIVGGSVAMAGGLAMLITGLIRGLRNGMPTGNTCYDQVVPMACLGSPLPPTAITLGVVGGALSLGGAAMILGGQLRFKTEPPPRPAKQEH